MQEHMHTDDTASMESYQYHSLDRNHTIILIAWEKYKLEVKKDACGKGTYIHVFWGSWPRQPKIIT